MCKLCRCPLRNQVTSTGGKEPAEARGNEIMWLKPHDSSKMPVRTGSTQTLAAADDGANRGCVAVAMLEAV